jgi:hypothetical protein
MPITVDTRFNSNTKGRIFVSLTEEPAEPVMDPCTDPTCGSASCMQAHACWIIGFLLDGREFVERLQPEDDHRQWKRYRKQQIDARRGVIAQAVLEGKLPDPGRLTFSQKAGCSCPCSPGFIADGGKLFGSTTWVTEVLEEGKEVIA